MTDPSPTSGRTVRITSLDDRRTQLLIDGKDISSKVMRLKLDINPQTSGHRLYLDVAAFPVDVEVTDVNVLICEETHDLLVWLGWTPPEEATNAIH